MKDTRTLQDKLRDQYGLNLGGYKYVLPGGEMLKYNGLDVVYVSYKKDEDSEKWNTEFFPARITSISDYDPTSMTYLVKFDITKDGQTEAREFRMIPDGGYSLTVPDQTKEMERLVPLSLHYQMGEDTGFFERLGRLYEERDTLEMEELKKIAESKDQAVLLRYSHNIGAAVKLGEGDYLWIRLHKIKLIHRNGDKYTLSISDDEKTWITLISEDEAEYNFNNLGMVKILDLAD